MSTHAHTSGPLQALRHHVSGAIARGESAPVVEMQQAKPTPGPWSVDYSGPAHLSVEDNAGRVLAFCNLQSEDGDEDEANARLIAAAPEMLQALRGLLREARESVPKINVKKHFSLMVCMEAAKEAIAKAEGGQQ